MSSVLKVDTILSVELDKQRLSEFLFAVQPRFTEEERFSPTAFNLKHYFTSSEPVKSSFKLEMKDLELVDPYRFELALNTAPQKAYLTYYIENAVKNKHVWFEIIDSDLLVEESYEIQNGVFTKKDSKIIEFVEYFIYNKNVG